jgi:hypothetical protein
MSAAQVTACAEGWTCCNARKNSWEEERQKPKKKQKITTTSPFFESESKWFKDQYARKKGNLPESVTIADLCDSEGEV